MTSWKSCTWNAWTYKGLLLVPRAPAMPSLQNRDRERQKCCASAGLGSLSRQPKKENKYSLCNSLRNETLQGPPATAPVSDNSALSQAQPLGLMEKSIFSVLQQPCTRLGVGRNTKVGWKQDSDCAQSQIYSDKTFPWKQQGREVLTQACKRHQIEMNKMQQCPVAKSLLGLFHFVSLAIFAWQLYNLGSSNIKIHLFKWLAVFWRWESSTADQRLQLLLQKQWMKFLKNWQVYFCNSFVSNYTKLNGVILLTHYLWHLQIYSWQSLKVPKLWIGRRLMNKATNAAQAMLPGLPVITDLFSSAPSSKQQDWLPCSTIKHTLSSSSSLLNFKTHNKTRTVDSTLCLCFHKGIWVCCNSSLQKRPLCLQ